MSKANDTSHSTSTAWPDYFESNQALAERPLQTRPPFYRVFLLNDDYTPMDFVVGVLVRFFAKTQEEAVDIMLAVHHSGCGLCGIFPRDVAESKVNQVLNYARQNEHPLACIMEES